MDIGINGSGLLASPNLDEIVDDIVASEDAGFSSYWLAQTGLLDALGTLSLAGRDTSLIELGTAVVPTWPRHPQALAAQALTTQAATGGRTILGIGLAHQPSVEDRWKMAWERPIRHILDYLNVLDPLLCEGSSDYDGDIWSFEGGAVRPTEDPPKVMLAALGDQMLRIAGRRTDGTILWCVGPKALAQQIVPKINDAAASVDRPAPRVVCSLPVAVTDDPAAMRGLVGVVLKDYATLPSYRAMLDIEGVQGVEEISLIGSEDEVREGLATIAESGATDFTAVVVASDPDERARTLAVLGEAQASR
ncbi:MAG: TIGR03564 family F420-dependent LLM class oxidoreductase [Actinomycetia bacterium]|nr:TIGR03564 family F420-dependent LLM class oxidoreductase [Actinomycetes bacterium]MCP4958921.1 TIGR03564 family F420-dependent LLM class oxidoreductase [Actinomycetes bacterium]